jgi:glucosamine-6-phosphate deaminase
MKVVLLDSPQDVAHYGADIFARQLKQKPDAVLGLATGTTPLSLYRELIERNRCGEICFEQVQSFNLDEYLGLPRDHPQSYRHFMNREFFDHLDIDKTNTHVPAGDAHNPITACDEYEHAIRNSGGIDIQLLGIGRNGHIGFNEPTSSFGSRTRIKTLTKQTVADNARFFGEDESKVPHHCITMGIGTIMEARMNLMLAFGEGKADAIAETVEGPVTSMMPASILQHHASAKVFIDEAAATKLTLADYYRWVYNGKPEWQRDA